MREPERVTESPPADPLHLGRPGMPCPDRSHCAVPLPVCSIESREILGETEALTRQGAGVCVGRPTPPTDVHIRV